MEHSGNVKQYSNRFATPGGHPGLQGSRASKFKKVRLRSLQKTKSEHEHASANEQEHDTEQMRNEGLNLNYQKLKKNCSSRGPGGHQMRAWRPKLAPSWPKLAQVGPTSASNRIGSRKHRVLLASSWPGTQSDRENTMFLAPHRRKRKPPAAGGASRREGI